MRAVYPARRLLVPLTRIPEGLRPEGGDVMANGGLIDDVFNGALGMAEDIVGGAIDTVLGTDSKKK